MRKILVTMLVSALAGATGTQVRAADDPKAVLDKGIKALGGEDNLAKVKAATWKSKGKLFIQGNANDFTLETTVEGLDHARSKFEGDFGGQKIEGTTVVAGDKGWRTFPESTEMDAAGVANEKRTLYLQVLSMTLVPLKGNDYKLEAAKEEQVDGKPALGIKVTGPDKKDFVIFFDKESGLPVKTAGKVLNFMGEEVDQETTYSAFKDLGGIKKATKSETKHNGEKLLESETTEFKVLDKVDPKTFAKPE
ncbi:MAG TPA: hypothetical protein VGX70_13945 [Gemmataceae bacterium]|nr:hypothetical protein [Gemmataceae bacterium]